MLILKRTNSFPFSHIVTQALYVGASLKKKKITSNVNHVFSFFFKALHSSIWFRIVTIKLSLQVVRWNQGWKHHFTSAQQYKLSMHEHPVHGMARGVSTEACGYIWVDPSPSDFINNRWRRISWCDLPWLSGALWQDLHLIHRSGHEDSVTGPS